MVLWIRRNLAGFRRQPDSLMVLHILGKTLGGLGAGLLIGAWRGADTGAAGWIAIGLSIALGLFCGRGILKARPPRPFPVTEKAVPGTAVDRDDGTKRNEIK